MIENGRAESPEQSESIDDSGEDTQLRFHYQAQRIACLAISLIVSQPKNARIYCELHEDGLVKHWDRTYTGYQFKSRERSQRKFRATEKVVLKAVRNFARLHKRFGIRIREFVIASNHPFTGDNDKNDLRLLVKVASEGSATGNAQFLEFWQSFSQQCPGFTQADIISVLRKVRLEDNEPDFNAALAAVVEELRTVPDLSGVDQPTLLNCARALISKVEECSRKHVPQSVGEEDEEHAHAKSSIKKKLLTADIVWNALQSAVRMPLGTSFRRIAVQSVPVEYVPVVKSAFASSGDSLKSTKRELADGTKFSRKELQELVQCASVSSANRISLLLGEPGSGKSALLAELCDDLSGQGITVLAVKCEDIPKDVQDQAKLAEFLGLPYAAAPCLSAVADSEPVVLVVDQLDAIGALWDTQTGRMQAVLALVHMVSKIANARVILSCREFDARFDVRISNLNACEVMLVLPSHDEVKGVLSAHGLDCSQWPTDVMDVLRNPQHLDIFVNLLKDSSNQITVVKNYLDLLGLLWSRRVQPDDERVLSRLCDLIGDRKQLFVPAAELSSERKSLDRLSGAGVLKFTNNGNNIGFAHQTLYEYCLARTFVQSDKSFSEYVVLHQHSLHARPLIWSCLHYLRNCDLSTYEREIGLLLQNGDLRAHVKTLLIQFLSQVSSPTMAEKSCMLPKIRAGELSDLDVIQLCKNSDWLDVLLPTYVATLMTDAEKSELAARLLANGCGARQEKIVPLLKEHWINIAARDSYTLLVLKEIKVWDTELCEIVCKIIERNNFNHTYLEFLISDMSESAPALAPGVVARWFKQQYVRACEHPKMDFTAPMDIPEEQRYFWSYRAMSDDPRLKAITSIIEGKQRYYLPEVARRAPSEFVEYVWPIFRQMLEEVAKEKDGVRRGYVSDLAHYTSQKQDKILKEKYSLISLFAEFMPVFALQNPQRYETFVEANAQSESLYIHRLLCWGLLAIVEKHADVALKYLLQDDRRLMIGSIYDQHSESIDLIRTLSPHVSHGSLQELEQRILQWEMYSSADILEEVESRTTYQRQHKLRLLTAIPEEQRTDKLRAFIEAEASAVPGFDKELMSEPEVRWAESPMSSEQMSVRSVAEVQALFEELDDECEDNPADWRQGGVYEASRELEKLAETDSKKALEISVNFVANKDEIAVAHLVRGLANSEEVTVLELEDIIVNFSSRGFASDKFFSAAASALDRRLNQKQSTGLRSDIVSLLESGVRALPQEPVAAYRESREREESILWSGSAFQLIPTEGMYPLLATLTQSYFTGDSPDVTRWLDILTYAVTLRSDPWTWQAFALTDLWRLNQIDHEVARQFLAVLFEKQPEVLNCRAGMILLSYVMGLLEPEYLAKIIDRIANSDWGLSEQACGELAGQDYFAHKNSWSRKLVEIGFTDSSKQNLAVGIAYTAGRAWRASRFRKEACKTIEQLLELNNDAVAEALAASMRLSEGLLPDDETFWLIDLLCSQPRLFRQGFAYIVEALPELMLWDAERVFRLLNAFTQEVGKDFLDHSTHMPYFAKHVVDATLTLQKIPGFEIKALELFEQQMALGMNEAQEIITEIDRLPKLMLRS